MHDQRGKNTTYQCQKCHPIRDFEHSTFASVNHSKTNKTMLKTIIDHRYFSQATANQLYSFYMDATQHAELTGAPASIKDQEGEGFNLVGGFCYGENVLLEKGHLIVQKWRVAEWPAEALDSLLILRFVEDEGGTHLFMSHCDLPEAWAESLLAGWDKFYWSNWTAALSSQTA